MTDITYTQCESDVLCGGEETTHIKTSYNVFLQKTLKNLLCYFKRFPLN